VDTKSHASHAGEQEGPAVGIDPEPMPVTQRRPHLAGQDLGQQLIVISLQVHGVSLGGHATGR
jgi:hypothetical protein